MNPEWGSDVFDVRVTTDIESRWDSGSVNIMCCKVVQTVNAIPLVGACRTGGRYFPAFIFVNFIKIAEFVGGLCPMMSGRHQSSYWQFTQNEHIVNGNKIKWRQMKWRQNENLPHKQAFPIIQILLLAKLKISCILAPSVGAGRCPYLF
ncbi:MAG: hypothetical protein ACRCUY_09570 [Thermoguttaceae bacterium]